MVQQFLGGRLLGPVNPPSNQRTQPPMIALFTIAPASAPQDCQESPRQLSYAYLLISSNLFWGHGHLLTSWHRGQVTTLRWRGFLGHSVRFLNLWRHRVGYMIILRMHWPANHSANPLWIKAVAALSLRQGLRVRLNNIEHEVLCIEAQPIATVVIRVVQ